MKVADNTVFRKVALERLSSPEQLDVLMQVTRPQSWLWLLALLLLAAATVYWGVFGQIPLSQPAQAVFIPAGGVQDVVGLHGGQLASWQVGVGETVARDQVIAEIVPLGLGQEEAVAVRSPGDGRLLAQHALAGQLVEPGELLAALQPLAEENHLEAVLYVSPAEARQIREGMPVTVAAASAAFEEPLAGVVTAVGDFPASEMAILSLVGSGFPLERLNISAEAIEVRVRLTSDRPVEQLPPAMLGSIGAATIELGMQRPIDFILPQR